MANKQQVRPNVSVNSELLLNWALQFTSLTEAKSFLSYRAKVSASLVQKLFDGSYASTPSSDKQRRICEATKISSDKLWKSVSSRRSKAS